MKEHYPGSDEYDSSENEFEYKLESGNSLVFFQDEESLDEIEQYPEQDDFDYSPPDLEYRLESGNSLVFFQEVENSDEMEQHYIQHKKLFGYRGDEPDDWFEWDFGL